MSEPASPAVAPVTGTMLRDLVVCERRVHHDLHGAAAERDEPSDFVLMLRDAGVAHEAAVLAALPGVVVDLRAEPLARRAGATRAALEGSADWIVGGRLELGDRVGHPDLLRRADGVWRAGDVKAGSALADDGRSPREEYAVQVGFYATLMGDLGLAPADGAFVIGADGELVPYDLQVPRGRGGPSWAAHVDGLVEKARGVRDGVVATRGALAAACAMCHWKGVCRRELENADDLTLVAGLGRAARGAIETVATSVTALAGLDVEGRPDLSRGLPGVGGRQLARHRDKARLLRSPGAVAYARRPLGLERHARELHLDLESDPLDHSLVYLHGILVRDATPAGDAERFVHFMAEGRDGERDAFAAAWAFIAGEPEARVFHFSKFERTSYRALQARHPEVCSPAEVEALFSPARSTDLLDVVKASTEWPLSSVGIKPIAKHLGFAWRDKDASGAASIAWWREYRRTGDPAVRARIVDYNHDDCRATAVLLDALLRLPVRNEPLPWPPAGAVAPIAAPRRDAGSSPAPSDGDGDGDGATTAWRSA